MLYLACDDIAQNLLSQAERAGKISLMGSGDATDAKRVIEGIISVIAQDSATERVNRELQLVTDIHKCTRNHEESPSVFDNRFNGAVARYVNHTSRMDNNTSRMFAIMLVRNANLTADTATSVSLQLSVMAQGRSNADENNSLPMSVDDVKKLATVDANEFAAVR